MNDLTHIDLFSGIGGFALAAGWAGFRTVAFCEIDKFCQEVLKARFGAVTDAVPSRRRQGATDISNGHGSGEFERSDKRPILIPDIFAFDGSRFRGATLLTGGFPCQPFSVAGKRRGKADDRHLWPEMLRVISESRPHWVVAENVSGIIRMELDQVLADLEMEGYACRTFHIGAVGVNAPHRRMRVWIVANRQRGGCVSGGERGSVEAICGGGQDDSMPLAEPDSDAQNPTSGGCGSRGAECAGFGGRSSSDGSNSDAPDAEGKGLEGRNATGAGCSDGRDTERIDGINRGDKSESWDIPWIEVATRLCRVDDGLPAWIHARRVARLKALGNSIVPQVAHQILKAIAEIEGGLT